MTRPCIASFVAGLAFADTARDHGLLLALLAAVLVAACAWMVLGELQRSSDPDARFAAQHPAGKGEPRG